MDKTSDRFSDNIARSMGVLILYKSHVPKHRKRKLQHKHGRAKLMRSSNHSLSLRGSSATNAVAHLPPRITKTANRNPLSGSLCQEKSGYTSPKNAVRSHKHWKH